MATEGRESLVRGEAAEVAGARRGPAPEARRRIQHELPTTPATVPSHGQSVRRSTFRSFQVRLTPTHPTPSTVASFQPPTTYLHYPDCHTATALATKDIIRTAEIILQYTCPVAVQYLVLFNRSPQFPQNRCPGAEELV